MFFFERHSRGSFATVKRKIGKKTWQKCFFVTFRLGYMTNRYILQKMDVRIYDSENGICVKILV